MTLAAVMAVPGVGSALAGAASSLLGGLFGKKNKTSQSVDLKKLVSDAQQAGFNPLTVLQSTGGTGWGSQVTANDFNPLAAAAAGAAQGFGDYWAQSKDRELMDAQIDLAKAQASSIRAIPSQATFGKVSDVSGTSPIGDANYWANWQGPMKPEENTVPVFDPAGGQIYLKPSVADRLNISAGNTLIVEDYEAISGEIASELEGVAGFVPQMLEMDSGWKTRFFGRNLGMTDEIRNAPKRGRNKIRNKK